MKLTWPEPGDCLGHAPAASSEPDLEPGVVARRLRLSWSVLNPTVAAEASEAAERELETAADRCLRRRLA